MPERTVMISLDAPGVASTHAEGTYDEFTPGRRLRRSVGMFLVMVLVAVPVAFVPIVHLIGVPLLLVTGIVLAILQLTYAGRLYTVHVPCPKCGGPNRIGGGLGRRSLAPSERNCENCRRLLTLRIDPVDAVAHDAAGTS
jgi:hypothetical protein